MNFELLFQQATTMLDVLITFLPRLVIAAIILIVTLFLSNRISSWTSKSLQRVRGFKPSATSMIASVTSFAVMVLGILAVLQTIGLGQVVYSTIASLGIVGLVLGFALQDITKQFASGVMLLLSRPFEIGDQIKVGAHEGVVTNLELRCTRLKTAGGDEVLIPNADVYVATVYNMSHYRQRRFAVPLQLPFAASLDHTRAHLIEAVSKIPGVSATPAPSVVCTAVADQKVSAEVRYWIETGTTNQDEIITAVIVAANRILNES